MWWLKCKKKMDLQITFITLNIKCRIFSNRDSGGFRAEHAPFAFSSVIICLSRELPTRRLQPESLLTAKSFFAHSTKNTANAWVGKFFPLIWICSRYASIFNYATLCGYPFSLEREFLAHFYRFLTFGHLHSLLWLVPKHVFANCFSHYSWRCKSSWERVFVFLFLS